MNIGSRIKELRKGLGLTQQKFADKIGMKQNTIAQWEMGRNEPMSAAVSLICQEFNVNEEWLRNGTGEKFAPEVSGEFEALAKKYDMNDMERIFLEKYLKLKKEERDAVSALIEKLWKEEHSEQKPSPPSPDNDLSALTVEQKVELYRQELEREEKAKEKSQALRENA